MSASPIDRREFIAGAAGVALCVSLPVSVAAAGQDAGSATPSAKLADWHVDDMWGVYPRPHEAVGFGRPQRDGQSFAAVAPVDAGFVV
jgi:hypothetical protein